MGSGWEGGIINIIAGSCDYGGSRAGSQGKFGQHLGRRKFQVIEERGG